MSNTTNVHGLNVNRVMHLTWSFLKDSKSWGYLFRRPLTAAEVYNPDVHFDPVRETSAFLNAVMPCDYIQVTWDINQAGVDEAKNVLLNGLSSTTVLGFPKDLGEWEYFTGTARDHIKAVFVPKGSDLDLSEIGVHVDLTPKGKKDLYQMAATAMKRLNRLFAPVEYSVFGQVVEKKADVYEVLLDDGSKVSIRVLPADVYVDGWNAYSPRGAELLAGLQNPRHGDGFRITAGTPDAFFKGHACVVDHLKYDAVFYGGKPEVHLDRFYHGRLSELHVSDPNTDFQSLINFFVQGNGLTLFGNMCEAFFKTMTYALQDSERFRRSMMAVHGKWVRKAESWDAQGLDVKPEWLCSRAASLGIDACFPGLFRSDIRMLSPLIDRVGLGVVPMSGFAQRRYLMPSPWIIDSLGNVCPENDRLKGQVAFSMDIEPGPIVMWRQPNGNVNERFHCESVQAPDLWKKAGRGQIIYLGADMIPQAMKAMGGADFDDPVIVSSHPGIVTHFKNLASYPEAGPASVQTQQEYPKRSMQFVEQLQYRIEPTKWTLHHLLHQVDDALNSTGIGVIVNALMLDTLITLGKSHMINDLTFQIEALEKSETPDGLAQAELLWQGIEWLEQRPDYVLRDMGNDLESRIDSIKMLGGSGMNTDVEAIQNMYDDTVVFPQCWTIGGFLGTGRIPDRIMQEGPITAKTQFCQMLEDTNVLREAFDEAVKEVEWLLTNACVPQELLAKYPRNNDIEEYVSDIRQMWFEQWEEARKTSPIMDRDTVAAIYRRISEELSDELYNGPFVEKLDHVAVRLAARVYKGTHVTAPLDEEGKTYHVRDGLLWTSALGNAFLDAIERTGLAGRVEYVQLLPGISKKLQTWGITPVHVENHVVFDPTCGEILGECFDLEDGSYMLDPGSFIVVKPAHSSLRVEWNLEDSK